MLSEHSKTKNCQIKKRVQTNCESKSSSKQVKTTPKDKVDQMSVSYD